MITGISASPTNENNTSIKPLKVVDVDNRQFLYERDLNAVAYSKAQLSEGDTMVYIKYSTDSEVYDATGFKMNGECFRVNSKKLLATGSKVFQRLFNEEEQTKSRRRNGFRRGLPSGIKFVINLTPPDEGDEALNLTANLSCSLGIRSWYTAEDRCKVSHGLVGGMDEVTRPVKSKSPTKLHDNLVDALTDPDFVPFDFDEGVSVPGPSNSSREKTREVNEHQELAEALRRSRAEFFPLQTGGAKSACKNVKEVLEYCPVRHRAGIEKLLQLIEGKEPRFDSAPKIWTLFVLAKHFDCTKIVVSNVLL